MKSVLEALVAVTGYPIPERTVETAALRRGLSVTGEPTAETVASRAFRLCEADLCMWLYYAPNVSQGGQSYSFTDAQREMYRQRAKAIYKALGEDDSESSTSGVKYGYKGQWL